MPTVGVLAEPPSLKRGIEEPCVRTKSSGSPRPKESLCSSCKDRKCHALRTQLQQPHSFLRSVLQRQNRTKIILSLPPRERRQPQAVVTLYGHHLLPLPRVRCRARVTLPCVRRCRTRKNNLVLKKEDSLVRRTTFRNLERNHAHAKLHFRNE